MDSFPDLGGFLKEQFNRVTSPFNKWVTGKALGRSPDPVDLHLHFWENGGGDDLLEEWLAGLWKRRKFEREM